MSQKLLEISNLIKTRSEGRGYELSIPELSLQAGDFVALMGSSGSGKSTALDILALILRPSQCRNYTLSFGDDVFDANKAWQGGNIDALADIRAQYFGYVLQVGGLLPFLNVRDNILLSRQTIGLSGNGPLEGLADSLNISHLLSKKIDQISVGERQRVAIARALVHEPKLVLADEPTSALDPVTAKDVLSLLISTTKEQNVALIIASHDWDLVREIGFKELYIEVDMSGVSTGQDSSTQQPIKAVLKPAKVIVETGVGQ